MKSLLLMLLSFCIASHSLAGSKNNYTTASVNNVYVDASIQSLPLMQLQHKGATLQFFTHGRPGQLFINGQWKSKEAITVWLKENYALSKYKHINIYGCQFAKDEKGLAAVKYIEQHTGVAVAASDNITGKDGDWVLEVGNATDVIKLPQYQYNLQCSAAPTVTMVANSGCTTNNGSLTVNNVLTPTADYQYSKDGGITWQASNVFNNLAGGNYNIRYRNINPATAGAPCNSSVLQTTVNTSITAAATPAGTATAPTSCSAPNGNISLNTYAATSGNTNYEFSINGTTWITANGTTTVPYGVTFTNLAAGSYNLVARNKTTGCLSAPAAITVNPPTAVTAPAGTATATTSCSSPNGSISLNTYAATSGNTNYEFSIDGTTWITANGTTTVPYGVTFTNLAAGSYNLVARNKTTGCSSAPAAITVNPPTAVTAPAGTATAPTSCSSPNGTISLNTYAATSGNTNYEFSIDGTTWITANGTTTVPYGVTFTNLAGGSYNLVARNKTTGCSSTATAVTVNPAAVPATPTTTIVHNTNCNTTPNGSITITNATYTPVANYSFSINNGSTWQTGAGMNVFSNLAEGNYNVVVRNNITGCISLTSIITLNNTAAAPAMPAGTATASACNASTGQISLNTYSATSGNSTYQFSINGTTWITANGTTTAPYGVTFTNLAPGTYNIIAKNITTGCVSANSTAITVGTGTALATPAGTATATSNCTSATGQISLSAYTATSGNTNFEFSVDGTNWITANGTSTAPYGVVFNNLAPGTYNIVARNKTTGCVSAGSSSITVSNPAALTAPAGTATATSNCTSATGQVSLSAYTATSGNTNFEFSVDGTNWITANGTTTAPYGVVFNNLAPGTYNIVARNKTTGCVSAGSTSITISNPAALTAPAGTATATSNCTGATGQVSLSTYTATSGNTNFEFSVDGTNWITANGTTTAPYGVLFNNLAPGTYNIVARNKTTGCVSAGSSGITVTNPAALAAPAGTATAATTCTSPNGSVSLSAYTATSGNTNFEFSINGTNWITANGTTTAPYGVLFNNLAPGTYNIVARNKTTGCVSAGSSGITVTNSAALAAPAGTATAATSCTSPNGSVSLSAYTATSGNTNFEFSIDGTNWISANGTSTAPYGVVFNNLAPGLYSILARNKTTGCVSANSADISLAASSVVATPSGTATATSNCTSATGQVSLSAYTATSGNTNFEFSIDGTNWIIANGTTTAPYGIVFNNLAPGTYIIVARSRTTGCVSVGSSGITVSNNAALATPAGTATATSNCTSATGQVSLSAYTATSGNTNFEFSIDGTNWITANGTSTAPYGVVFNNLAPGTYNIVARNKTTGCVSAGSSGIIVTNNAALTAPAGTATAPSNCTSIAGQVSLSAYTATSGNSNFEFSVDGTNWITANGTTTAPYGVVFNNLAPGTYNIVARNKNTGCVSAASASITVTTASIPATPTVTAVNSTSCLTNNGTITVTAPTPLSSYQFSVDNGTTWQASSSFTGLAPSAAYNVKVKNIATGCISLAQSATVGTPSAVTAPVLTTTNVTNCNTPNGSIVFTPPADGYNYSFSIDGGLSFSSNPSFTGLSNGPYTVVIKNNNTGCVSAITAAQQVTLTNGTPTIVTTSSNATSCFPNGSITVTTPASGSGYTYSKDGGATWQASNVFSNLDAGTYTIVAKNSTTGCITGSSQNTLTNSGAIAAPSVTTTPQTCTTLGSIIFTSPTPLNYYNFSIDGGSTFLSGTSFTNLATGTYPVAVKSLTSGCISKIQNVTVPDTRSSGNCADTDGDGVSNENDIDDDNDGVLDSQEQTQVCVSAPPVTGTNVSLIGWMTNAGACFMPDQRGFWWLSETLSNGTNETYLLPAASQLPRSAGSGMESGSSDANCSFGTKSGVIPTDPFATNHYVEYKISTTGYSESSYLMLRRMGWNNIVTSKLEIRISDNNFSTYTTVFTPKSANHQNILFDNFYTIRPNKTYSVRVYFYTTQSGLMSDVAIDGVVSTNVSCSLVDIDTDNDGIPNRLDLDSDGDGCSDANEAGATTSLTPNYHFDITPDANGNGLNDTKETGTTGTINYTSTYSDYAIVSGIKACIDTDGDGISDITDIDDDNDGVLDVTEMNGICNTASATPASAAVTPSAAFGPISQTIDNSGMVGTGITATTNGPVTTSNAWYGPDNTTTATIDYTTAAGSGVSYILLWATECDDATVGGEGPIKDFTVTVTYNGGANTYTSGTFSTAKPTGVGTPNYAQQFNFGQTFANVTKITLTVLNGWYDDDAVKNDNWVSTSSTTINSQYNLTLAEFRFGCSLFADIDTDNDGIPNRLDLDSDGDGCSDAKEAGATTSIAPNYQFAITPDVNSNGLNDTKETGTTGTINYTSTYTNYAIVAGLNACIDTDNDGISDAIDIDDDNDGVLDVIENGACSSTPGYGTKWNVTVYDYTAGGFDDCTLSNSLGTLTQYASGTITSGTDLSLNWANPGTQVDLLASLTTSGATLTGSNPPDISFAVYHEHTFTATDAGIYTIAAGTIYDGKKFYKTLANGTDSLIYCNTAFNIQNSAIDVRFEAGTKLKIVTYENGAGNTQTVINITPRAGQQFYNNCADIDTDGDGIPNRLDLDSDGDGCSDAKEAGATTSTTANYQFAATPDANGNGLNDTKETGTTGTINYTSTYTNYAIVSGLNGCTDTDGDGVPDIIDIDDDNDGILDVVENPCLSPNFYEPFGTGTVSPNRSSIAQVGVPGASGGYIYNSSSAVVDGEYTIASYVNTGTMGGWWSNIPYLDAITPGGNAMIINGSGSTYAYTSPYLTNWYPGKVYTVSFYVRNGNNLGNFPNLSLIVEDALGNQIDILTTGGVPFTDSWVKFTKDVTVNAPGGRIRIRTNSPAGGGNDFYMDEIRMELKDPSGCVYDTDGDGIPNYLDLDSDGDGCSDALEAGSTTSTTPNYHYPATPDVNGNGLNDNVESGTSGTINYPSTYYPNAINVSVSNCIDTDGDGIPDSVDIDDDNDGIPDAVEAPSCYYTQAEAAVITGVSSDLVFDATNTIGRVVDNNINTYTTFNPAAQSIQSKAIFQIAFTAPVRLDMLTDSLSSSTSIFAASAQYYIRASQYPNGPWDTVSAVLNTVTPVANKLAWPITATKPYKYYQVWGISNTTTNNGNSVELIPRIINYIASASPKPTCGVDTDGDGITNDKDLDSDGDGCSDAREAGATTSTAPNYQFPGPYGPNGLDDTKETLGNGVTNYPSTYYQYALNGSVNFCTDTDGDGVPDFVDIDDDNDGILDAIEAPSCYYTSAEASVIAKVSTGLASSVVNSLAVATGADIATMHNSTTTTVAAQDHVIAANQTITTSSVIYTVEYPTAVKLSSVSVIGATADWGTGSFAILEGSNDGINFNDALSAPLATSAGTTKTWNVTLNATNEYRYYRIRVSTVGSTKPAFTNFEVSAVQNTTGYIPSAHPKPTCGVDTDNDGITNDKDLDSDGDNCPDAVEAGVYKTSGGPTMQIGVIKNGTGGSVNNQLSATNAVVSGPYGANGFANSVESMPSESGNYNDTYTYATAIDKNAQNPNCANVVLPVNWLTVKATLKAEDAVVAWKVNEKQVAYYRVLRSLDGTNFIDIAKVNATSSTAAVKEYSYTDTRVTSLNVFKVFYRIVSVDIDGRTSYTEIVSVSVPHKGAAPMVYPNPNQGIANFTTLANVKAIEIFNAAGALVKSIKINNSNQLSYDISVLPSGFYTMRLLTDAEPFHLKVNIIR